jgi:hypothetical protein
MDWQQIASLIVVAITAGAFLQARLRRRKFSFGRDTHCGCGAPSGSQESIVFHARKGQRARIMIKTK